MPMEWLENDATWTKDDAQHRSCAYKDEGSNGPASNVLLPEGIWNTDTGSKSCSDPDWIVFDLKKEYEVDAFEIQGGRSSVRGVGADSVVVQGR